MKRNIHISLLFVAVAVTAAIVAGCVARAPAGPVRYEITVGTSGYTPDRVQARVGQEVVLVFKRVTDQTCGTELVIPSENVRMALPLNQPVEVRITPKQKGEIPFTCGMKMLQGTIEVD